MIELDRMARAAYEEAERQLAPGPQGWLAWDRQSETMREHWRRIVRAVLKDLQCPNCGLRNITPGCNMVNFTSEYRPPEVKPDVVSG